MEEIKVGEYVRTDNGEIHKVEDIEDLRIHIETEKIMFRSWVEDYYGTHKEDRFIVKHSNNIINLIEVGDFVNGEKVTGIMSGYVYLDKIDIETKKVKTLTDYQIKDIVTKEQFNQVKYEV